MATRIRLRRMGRKKLPFYRIVVADKAAPRDGRFIEVLGTYDPRAKTDLVLTTYGVLRRDHEHLARERFD